MYEDDRVDDYEDEYDDFDEDGYEPAMLPCPECGAEILEDCEQCPHCRQYIEFDHGPLAGRSPVITRTLQIVVILLVLALLAPFLLMLQELVGR